MFYRLLRPPHYYILDLISLLGSAILYQNVTLEMHASQLSHLQNLRHNPFIAYRHNVDAMAMFSSLIIFINLDSFQKSFVSLH